MIAGSYPSRAGQWTVVAASGPSFVLAVTVSCLPANPAYGVQIVQGDISPDGSVTCPAGTVLLGGGVQGTEVIAASHPEGNGWYASTYRSVGQVYTLCASQHVAAGSIATSIYNPHSSSHGYVPGGTKVACPPGQMATSGGFGGGDLLLASESDGAPATSWTFTTGGDADETFSAVCVNLAA
jgi:hypothetical protein